MRARLIPLTVRILAAMPVPSSEISFLRSSCAGRERERDVALFERTGGCWETFPGIGDAARSPFDVPAHQAKGSAPPNELGLFPARAEDPGCANDTLGEV